MNGDASNIYDFPDAVIRFFQKSADADDLKELHLWLQEDKEHQRLFDEYQDVWSALGKSKSSQDYNSDEAWQKLFPEINSEENDEYVLPQKSFNWKKLLQAAVIILMAFAAGVYSVQYFSRKEKPTIASVTEHSVPYGSRSMVTLPDGTKIWLNAGSKIDYNQNYNIKSREITLVGEAYFDVKTNLKLPFLVHASYINVKVLGTAFNIKAYPEERMVEMTVERGQVYLMSRGKQATLNPGQKVIIYKIPGETAREAKLNDSISSVAMDKNPVTIDSESPPLFVQNDVLTELSTSWKDKRWIIEREELGSLAVKIGRRYDVNITFANENMKHYIFSGALENESLDQVLQIIQFTAPIYYTINKKQVLFKENSDKNEYLKTNR